MWFVDLVCSIFLLRRLRHHMTRMVAGWDGIQGNGAIMLDLLAHLNAGRFEVVNTVLEEIDMRDFCMPTMGLILAVTKPYEADLPSRAGLVDLVLETHEWDDAVNHSIIIQGRIMFIGAVRPTSE